MADADEPAICGATTVFWPDIEACEAECALAPHDGPVHSDLYLGEWTEDELRTSRP